ncbi:MAG TPA: DUF6687 family protein [Ignavibacteriales bacterium]|nr:DUF6687 family protein [Ignavibacteriales bacterium]
MKFLFERYVKDKNKCICVDGMFESKLQLSHWPGNGTPYELRGDTSTEIAFNLLESPRKNKYLEGVEYVSNNHFDGDGIIASYVLLFPDEALEHKEELINMARTGDFSEFSTEDALKANIVIESLLDSEKSIYKKEISELNYPDLIQFLYEKAHELIPGLLKNIDNYQKIWDAEFKEYLISESSFESRESVFSDYGDSNLSVIETKSPLHKVSKFKHAKNDIVLTVIKTDKGNLYELQYKDYTWFDTVRENKLERKTFNELVEKLKEIEKNKKGEWLILGRNPISEWDYRLIFGDESFQQVPSSLAVYEIENILFDYFQIETF